MAKFYFHLRDQSEELLDLEGIDCPNANAIVVNALTSARDLIAGEANEGAIDMTQRIDVEDTSHTIVHSLEFEDAVTIKHAA
jgi:hypothetical protein